MCTFHIQVFNDSFLLLPILQQSLFLLRCPATAMCSSHVASLARELRTMSELRTAMFRQVMETAIYVRFTTGDRMFSQRTRAQLPCAALIRNQSAFSLQTKRLEPTMNQPCLSHYWGATYSAL